MFVYIILIDKEYACLFTVYKTVKDVPFCLYFINRKNDVPNLFSESYLICKADSYGKTEVLNKLDVPKKFLR